MPRARTLLLALTGLLILAVLAVWQVPQWLDWARYRGTIETLASATLGQPVTIEGPIALTLLPEPLLTATQVDIGNGSTNDVSVRVKALRLRVALWPLLRGRVDARDLVLRGADVRIPSPTESGVLQAQQPAWLAAFVAQIEDGSLTMGQLRFTGINATLQSTYTGALSASGSARFNNLDWHVTAQLTSRGADGAAGLNATLDGQDKAAGLGVSLAGQLAADGSFAGTISSRGPNLAMLLPAPPVAFRADGRLTIGGGLAVADNLSLEIGGSPASGAVALRVSPLQRLDIALSASRLDLDAWLPVLLNASNSVAGIDLPISVDLSANAAPLGGDMLENVQAAFDISDQTLSLREGHALLPGNGRLRLTGSAGRTGVAHLRFEGDATLDAPMLRTTLRWLHNAAPDWLPADYLSHLPDGVLQRAAFSTHLTADSGELLLQHMAGTVDTSSIVGSVAFRRGARPSFSADLTLDHAPLDDWLPTSAQVPKDFDTELRLNIRNATLHGSDLRNLAIDAGIEGSAVALRKFDATIDGAQISASGQIGKNQQITDGKLSVTAPDATPLMTMLPADWHATPALWHGPLQLSLQAAGSPSALNISAKLSLDDATLDATPTIDLGSGQWNGQLTIRHPGARRLLAALGLPELTGLPNLPEWLGDGSLSLVAQLHGSAHRAAADDFELTAGAFRLAGNFVLDQASGEPHLAAQLRTDTLTVPLPNAASEVSLPIGLLRGWQGDLTLAAGTVTLGSDATLHNATATITVAGGAMRIERLAGKLNGGTLSGTGLFNAAANPASLAMQAHLDDATIDGPALGTPIDLIAGTVQGSLDLTANGYSPATIISTLTGHLAIMATDGAVSGFDLSRAKQAAQQSDPMAAQKAAGNALETGTTQFDRLDITGSLAHGDLTLDSAHLHADAGEADATGDANLPGQSLDLHIVLRPALRNSPEIAVQLTGPVDHPQWALDVASLARFVAMQTH